MPDRSYSRQVTVVNPQGLHARPADMLVKLASQYESKVEILKDAERADAKSILSILTLAAVQGTELTIEASGSDAREAAEAIADLIRSGFVEQPEDESQPETQQP